MKNLRQLSGQRVVLSATLVLFLLAFSSGVEAHGEVSLPQNSSILPVHHVEGHGKFVRGQVGTSIYPYCKTKLQLEDVIRHYGVGGDAVAALTQLRAYLGPHNKFRKAVCSNLSREKLQQGVVWRFIVIERVGTYPVDTSIFGEDAVEGVVYIIKVHPLHHPDTFFHLLSTWDVVEPEESGRSAFSHPGTRVPGGYFCVNLFNIYRTRASVCVL